MASVQNGVSLFGCLISFIDNHEDRLDRRSFPCQMFSFAVSMLGVGQHSDDLQALRSFAKSVIAQNTSRKDDLSAILCRSLLAEIVKLEQQMFAENEQIGRYQDKIGLTVRKRRPPIAEISADSIGPVDSLELVRVVKQLAEEHTRAEGIRGLLELDEKFPQERIAETMLMLGPNLRKEVEAARNHGSGSGTRGSQKASEKSGHRSRPSSRNSNRTVGGDHSGPFGSTRL
jgi:hypothetical protein